MAIPLGLLHLTFRVRLGGSEIALYGFHHRTVPALTGWSQGLLDAMAEKVRDAWLEEMDDVKGVFSNAATWEYVRCDLLNPAGGAAYLKVLGSGFSAFSPSGENSYVGTGSPSMPWASSEVVSLAAYSPGEFEVRKARWRGRYYLPPTGTGSIEGTTGELSNTATPFLANHLAAFHAACQGEISPQVPDETELVVLSRADDTARRVEQLWVDSKIDHQRRRENRQPATFKTVVLMPE